MAKSIMLILNSWTLYLISQNRHVEAKIIEEIKQVFENGRSPTVEDVPKFPYLHNVFTESLRLYPPAWAIGREAIDNVIIGNYSIPRGSVIVMSQYIITVILDFSTNLINSSQNGGPLR
jgi:cytochrome P450